MILLCWGVNTIELFSMEYTIALFITHEVIAIITSIVNMKTKNACVSVNSNPYIDNMLKKLIITLSQHTLVKV